MYLKCVNKAFQKVLPTHCAVLAVQQVKATTHFIAFRWPLGLWPPNLIVKNVKLLGLISFVKKKKKDFFSWVVFGFYF